MSASNWTVFPYEARATTPELDLPLEYTVPFSWGSLRVTESAHQAYGLIPLVPTTDDRPEGHASSNLEPEVNILLVGPDEASEPIASDAVGIQTQLHKTGVTLTAIFGSDFESMTEGIKQNLAKQLEGLSALAGGDVLDSMVDSEGINVTEALKHEVPQLLVHGMALDLQDSVHDGLLSWYRMEHNKSFLNSITKLGGLTLAGSGIMLALPNLLQPDLPLTPSRLVVPGAFAFFSLLSTRSAMKRWLQINDIRELNLEQQAHAQSSVVSEEFHRTFCRSHFNQQLESQVNGDEQ